MPELGKATYYLIVNSAQALAGLAEFDAASVESAAKVDGSMGRATAAIDSMAAAAGVAGETAAAGFRVMGAGALAGARRVEEAAALTGTASRRAGALALAGLSAVGSRVSSVGRTISGRLSGATLAGMTALGTRMSKTGKELTRHVTTPILAIAGAATYMALKFSQQMRLVQTQAGGTARDVRVLSRAILDLAGHTVQGPVQLAQAMFHLKSLGLDNAKAMGVLRAASDGAMVGVANLEETTNALGGAVRTGIKGTGDYGKAMGTLNGIIGVGNMRMEDLVAAMGTGILPTAKLAGLSLRDVGAALAIFTDENVPATQAMTRFKTALMLMAAPSEHAEKQLKRIGLSGIQLAEAFQGPKGLLGALKLVKDHLDKSGLDKAEKFQLISKAFGGARGASTIMALLNQYDLLVQKHRKIGQVAKKYQDDVEVSRREPLNQLKMGWSSVEVALIKLGRIYVPIVVGLMRGFARVANAFSALPAPVRKFLAVLSLVVAAVGPLTWIAGKLLLSLARIIPALRLVGLGLMFVGRGVIALGMALLTNPIGLILVALVLLGVGLFIAYKKVAWFRHGVQALARAFMGVLNWVRAHWREVIPLVAGPFAPLVMLATNAFGIRSRLVNAFSAITGWLRSHWRQLLIAAVTGPLHLLVPWAYREAVKIGKAIFDGIKHGFGNLGHFMSSKLHGAVNFAKRGMRIFSPSLETKEKIGIPLARGVIAGWNEGIKPFMSTVLGNIEQVVRAAGYLADLQHGIRPPAWGPHGARILRNLPHRPHFPHRHTRRRRTEEELLSGTTDVRTGIQHDIDVAQREVNLAKQGTRAWQRGMHDLIRADEEAVQELTRRLKHTRNTKVRNDLYEAITQLRQDQHDAYQQLYDESHRAEKKRKRRGIHAVTDLPARLHIAYARAERTKGVSDDIRVLREEIAYLKDELKHKKLSLKERAAVEEEITQLDKKISRKRREATKKKRQHALDTAAELEAVMDLRGTWLGEFGSTIFHKTSRGLAMGAGARGGSGDVHHHRNLEYNQENHYSEIPRDRHAQSRQLALAAGSVLD